MTKEKRTQIAQLARHRDYDFATDLRDALRECLAYIDKCDRLKEASEAILNTWVESGRPRLRIIWFNEACAQQFDQLEAAIKRLDI